MASTIQQTGGSIAIKDEGVTLVASASSIDFVGAGVTGNALGGDVTETIPGGAGLSKETPSGAINDSNVTFTVANTPKFIQLNGAVQEDGGVDYTLSVLTITFVNPPPTGSILRSYY